MWTIQILNKVTWIWEFLRNIFVQMTAISSEGQEKYLRELSITPVGYFTGAITNHSRAVSHSENEVFQRNRNYFTLDVI
jgi:hypothetical protein